MNIIRKEARALVDWINEYREKNPPELLDVALALDELCNALECGELIQVLPDPERER